MARVLLPLILIVLAYLWWRPDTLKRLPPKALPILIGFIYLLSPIDLIPDALGPGGFLDDLIVLAAGYWWARSGRHAAEPGAGRSQEHSRRQASPRDRSERDPYDVLEIERDAPRDEIVRAYREKMKQYHPDRVSGLGPELQDMAHEKTVEIQRAYERLEGKR